MISTVQAQIGKKVKLKGTAYDFDHRICAIQFSLDEGRHWTTYETNETNDYQNVTWTFEYKPPRAGRYELCIRSVNDCGQASPESARVHLEVADATEGSFANQTVMQ